jgi:hypothetical protein
LLNINVVPGGVNANGGSAGASYSASPGAALGTFSRYQDFGGGTIGWGLVTEFDFTPVPEPSTLTLSATGFGFLLACGAISRRRQLRQSLKLTRISG